MSSARRARPRPTCICSALGWLCLQSSICGVSCCAMLDAQGVCAVGWPVGCSTALAFLSPSLPFPEKELGSLFDVSWKSYVCNNSIHKMTWVCHVGDMTWRPPGLATKRVLHVLRSADSLRTTGCTAMLWHRRGAWQRCSRGRRARAGGLAAAAAGGGNAGQPGGRRPGAARAACVTSSLTGHTEAPHAEQCRPPDPCIMPCGSPRWRGRTGACRGADASALLHCPHAEPRTPVPCPMSRPDAHGPHTCIFQPGVPYCLIRRDSVG